MSIQNSIHSIQRLKVTSIGSFPRFLIMFIAVVVGPLVLLVIGGYDLSILGLASSAWFFLAIALLLIVSIGGGFLMSRRKSDAGERSLYQP
jgi:carbon starvation protein CstA